MADQRTVFSPGDIDEAWRDPEFNSETEDRRISIISEMDPRFAALPGIDRRRIAGTMYSRFGKPATPPPQRPPTEGAADLALAQSGLPPAAPPDMGRIRVNPVEEGRVEAMFRSNPFQRNPKPQQTVAPAQPMPEFDITTNETNASDLLPRPLSLPAKPPDPTLPATKPTGIPRNVARQGPYTTILQPAEEQEFRKWVAENNLPFDPGPQSDYDMRGFWRAQRQRDQRAVIKSGTEGKPELPDSWKTPFHQTFSADSIYAGPDAPKWVGGKLVDSFGRVLKDKDYEKAAGKAFNKQQKSAERLASKNLDRVFERTPLPSYREAPAGPPVDLPLGAAIPGSSATGIPGIQPAPQADMPKTWEELRTASGIEQPDVIVDPNTGMDVPVGASPEQWAQFGQHDPVRTGLKAAYGGAAQMALDAPGGLATMAGNATGSQTLQGVGSDMTALGQNAATAFAPPPTVQSYEQVGSEVFKDPHWWASTIGNGIGSMAPLMVSGAGAGALIEKGLQMGLIRGALADKVIRYGPSAVAGLSEGVLAGGNAYNEAKASGASEDQARAAFATVAATTALTSAPAFAAGAFNEALPLAARIPAGMGAEGLQEVAQGRGEDLARQDYNPGATMGSQDVENFVGGAFGGAAAAPMEMHGSPRQDVQRGPTAQSPTMAPLPLQVEQQAPPAPVQTPPVETQQQQPTNSRNPFQRKKPSATPSATPSAQVPAPPAAPVEDIPADIDAMMADAEEREREPQVDSYDAAVEVARRRGRITPTLLQNDLVIDGPQAEALAARLEKEGVVGPAENGVRWLREPGEAEAIASEVKNEAKPDAKEGTRTTPAPAPTNSFTPASAEVADNISPKSKTELETEEKKPDREFSSTQVNLPQEEAQAVRELAARIPDEALTEDGREDDVHATVKFGLHGNDPEAVRRVLADEGPVRVKLGKVSLFENDDADVVKIDVDSPDLHRLNKKIADAIPHTDTHPDYKPHVTIAYVKPGQGKKFLGLNDLEGREITLNALTFSSKDRSRVEIPLGGKLEEPAQNQPVAGDTSHFPTSSEGGQQAKPLPSINPTRRSVERATIKRLRGNPQGMVKDYRTRFGNVFNADDAAELFPEYAGSLESRFAHHKDVMPAARWVRDEAFRQAISEAPRGTLVVFTAGGPASTKSTGATPYKGSAYPVLDSILGNYDSATQQIEMAKDAGHPVVVHYVYRDPVDAFHSSFERSKTQGRNNTPDEHLKAHEDARNTAVRLYQTYLNDPRVKIDLRQLTSEGRKSITIDELQSKDYTGVRERLHQIERARSTTEPDAAVDGGLEGRTGEGVGDSGGDRERGSSGRGRTPEEPAGEIAGSDSAKTTPKATATKRRGPTQRPAKVQQHAGDGAPSSISDLKPAELKRLRGIKLEDGPTRVPRGMSIGELDSWQKRGWIDENGLALTPLGEQAVRDVEAMDQENAKGRPFSEYKAGAKRIEDPSGRFSFTKPISVNGESWHTNGHFAALGPPPSYWKPDPNDAHRQPPELHRVLPKKRAQAVQPVGFAPIQDKLTAIYFSNGAAMNSAYFDYVRRLHGDVEWAAPSTQTPVEAYKDGKLVAVVMPIRTEAAALPERIKGLVSQPDPKRGPQRRSDGGSAARLEAPAYSAGRETGDQGTLGFSSNAHSQTAISPAVGLDPLPSTSLPRIPVNRTKIVRNLQERLKGLAIRTGNFRRPRALGIFKVKQNVIRTKKPLDLPTIAHEVGHAVHKYLWGMAPNGQELNSKPLKPFASELGPLDYDQTKQRPYEGFAEYMRLRLTDPVAASNAAPTFDAWLNTVLDTHPDIRDTLNDARSEILTWMAQPAAVKLGMSINTEPESESRWKQFMNFFSEYEWVDDKVDLKNAVETFSRLGSKVSEAADAYKLARMVNGSYTRAFRALTRGTVDANYKPNGGSLLDTLKRIASRPADQANPEFSKLANEWQLKMAEDGMDDLRLYLVARRMQNYHDNGLETGFTPSEIKEAVAATETDAIRAAAQEIHDFQDRILQYVVDKGAMTDAVAERIREKNDFYVPLYRVMDDQVGRALVGRKMIDLNSPVMRRTGSTRDVIDPLESIVRNTYTMISFADRQEVAQALVRQAGRVQDQGALIESGIIRPSRQVKFNLSEVSREIRDAIESAGIDLGELQQEDLDVMATIYRPNNDAQRSKGIVKVIVDGEPRLFQMAPDLIRGLDSLDRGTAHPLIQMMTPAKNVLTFSATAANPEFIFTNFMRDQMTAGFQSRNDFIPFAHGLYGAFKMLTDPALVDEWERNGGATAAILPLTRDNLRLSVNKMTMSKKDIVLRNPAELFTLLTDVLTIAGTYSEQSTRLAEYALAKRNGKSEADAAFDSRDVTLDFERMGHTARAMNQAIPFFAVTLNAGQRFAEMHNPRNPELFKQAMLRGFLGVTIPSMILWALNHDDDDYKNIEAWKRDLFWLIPTKPMGLSDTFGPFIRIPKPPLWGQLYGSLFERLADGLVAEKPDAFKGFLNTILQQAVPDATAQTFKPAMEVMANYNSFTDRQIESDSMRRLSPVNRYHSGTSETAKLISKGLDTMGVELSPLKVEHLMLGYTAGLGRFAVSTTEELLGLRDDRPEMAPSETPLLRALATPAEPYQSENSVAFYERLKKLEQRHADALHIGDAPKGAARRTAGLSEEEFAQIKALRGVARQLAGIRRQQFEVEHSNLLTRHEKRVQIDELAHTREALLRQNRDLFVPGK